jgi:molybdopterin molybdotransferase
VKTTAPGPGPGSGQRAGGASGLVPVEEYLASVLAQVTPAEPARLGLEAAEGGVLAEDAVAACALPPFDNSAMDGYAVHAADVAGASPGSPVTLPVAGEVPAGDTRALAVPPGTAMRIMTGALLPGGADAVIPVEWTDGGRERVRISKPAPAGHAIRRRGEDLAEGEVLLPAGTVLGPAQVGLLAAGGHGAALVRPRPRVSVIATGNELAEPGTPLTPGQIWDSNSYLLAAAARQAGAVVTRQTAGDDPQTVRAEIEAQASRSHLLITSGGVSMGGEHDVLKAALAGRAGVRFEKVAMQPGMPQGFGVVGPSRTPLLMLPGNPVSAFVSFLLFARPALAALQGLAPAPLPAVRAALSGPVRSPAGKRSFLRGVLDRAAGTVTPLGGQGSHQLAALARANALIVIPEPVTGLAAGETVDVLSLP